MTAIGNPAGRSFVELSVSDDSRRPRRDENNSEEFQHFSERISPTLFRAAYLLLGDWSAAEDAPQTTLMRTFQHWRRARANPSAYSRTVVVNLCRDLGRRRQRSPETTVKFGDLDENGHPDATDAIVQRIALEVALAALPGEQREVLVLRFFLDLSVEEVAETLGMAEGTVKSSTSRALTRLRDLVVSDEKEDDVVAD
jgi:RNA polymerase sigma-70 factor (sigma-E family)